MELRKKQRWSSSEDRTLIGMINDNPWNIKEACEKFAIQSNRSARAAYQHYSDLNKKGITVKPEKSAKHVSGTNKQKKWTAEEEAVLFTKIKANTESLSKCFINVADQTGRSYAAVQKHWYRVMSVRPDTKVFATVSGSKISVNRKNTAGKPVSSSLWDKIFSALKSVF